MQESSQTYLGPFPDIEELYLVTRHPLAPRSKVKPFGSMDAKFWINYILIFSIFILISLSGEIKFITFNQMLRSMIFPTQTKLFKLCLGLAAIWSFTIWTFNQIYGIDLHKSLVGQIFEKEINEWNDFNFFQCQFIYVINSNTKNEIPRFVAPGFLELHLLMQPYFHSKLKVANINDLSSVNKVITLSQNEEQSMVENFNLAQLMKSPSDIIFVMTKNRYLQLAKVMNKRQIPFKMRLSTKATKSHVPYMWVIPKHSLLMEPFSRTILTIKVFTDEAIFLSVLFDIQWTPLIVATLGSALSGHNKGVSRLRIF